MPKKIKGAVYRAILVIHTFKVFFELFSYSLHSILSPHRHCYTSDRVWPPLTWWPLSINMVRRFFSDIRNYRIQEFQPSPLSVIQSPVDANLLNFMVRNWHDEVPVVMADVQYIVVASRFTVSYISIIIFKFKTFEVEML
jgi:hypothetical protein